MKKLLVVTHGNLAKEIISTAELIAGKIVGVASLGLYESDNSADFLNMIRDEVRKLDDGNGVLIMNDLFGGTPSNLSIFISESESSWAISGVSIPMILEFLTLRNENLSLEELAERCVEAGKEFVINSTKRKREKE